MITGRPSPTGRASPTASTEIEGWSVKNSGFKTGNQHLLKRFTGGAFNCFEQQCLLCCNEGDRMATFTGTTGAADAMHIILRHVG